MAEPYVGEIKIFAIPFAPKGWAQCNGQLLPLNQNQALFSLIGTYFGGNGQSNFSLPDLRGRTPICAAPGGYVLGQPGGVENVTLIGPNLAPHTHTLNAVTALGDKGGPPNHLLAQCPAGSPIYAVDKNPLVPLAPNATQPAGGPATPHNNMQPFLTVNMCIALSGVYPSRN